MASEQGDFAGLRVAAFESRRATDMERLLTRAGAVASVSPSMREVPLGAADEVVPNLHPTRHGRGYPESVVGQAGRHMVDTACPIGPHTWEAACAA